MKKGIFEIGSPSDGKVIDCYGWALILRRIKWVSLKEKFFLNEILFDVLAQSCNKLGNLCFALE